MTRPRRLATFNPLRDATFVVVALLDLILGVAYDSIPPALRVLAIASGVSMLTYYFRQVFQHLETLLARAPYRPGGGPDGDGERIISREDGQVIELGPRRAA
jgi:hypothetical protein